ncbi:MAG: sulfatase, partial [Verrucomicrobiae bacterium]|nr:sulfatase [Verrucomicrobiae bacterium]
MRKIAIVLSATAAFAAAGLVGPRAAAGDRLPNVVIVFTDDQGYADVGVFGAEGFETPNLDRMAAEGRKFTRWYAGQPVCSASRTALLTGCYSNRVGIHGALGPGSRVGIGDGETLLPEIFKQKGYATAIFGKWHLGDHEKFLPTRHGFDTYFGFPYSNDMWPQHPEVGDRFPPLPLFENGRRVRIADEHDQAMMTTRITTHAVDFITENRDRPFFLYVPHHQPHVPLFVSERFRGKTRRGLYGDVISEIDWSVGEILNAIKTNGLDDNTLVIFTSDNGPWLSYGEHAGSAGPLREGKGTVWEGGVREACIMRWPGKIPAGTECDTPAMNIDLLPTLAKLIGAEPPKHPIDGLDIWPVLAGEPGAKNPHEGYWYYYKQNELQAVSQGTWKLYLPHEYRTLEGRPGGKDGIPAKYGSAEAATELYDLSTDVGEKDNVAAAHPDVVEKLLAFAEKARAELGDNLTKRKGAGIREPGRLTDAEAAELEAIHWPNGRPE